MISDQSVSAEIVEFLAAKELPCHRKSDCMKCHDLACLVEQVLIGSGAVDCDVHVHKLRREVKRLVLDCGSYCESSTESSTPRAVTPPCEAIGDKVNCNLQQEILTMLSSFRQDILATFGKEAFTSTTLPASEGVVVHGGDVDGDDCHKEILDMGAQMVSKREENMDDVPEKKTKMWEWLEQGKFQKEAEEEVKDLQLESTKTFYEESSNMTPPPAQAAFQIEIPSPVKLMKTPKTYLKGDEPVSKRLLEELPSELRADAPEFVPDGPPAATLIGTSTSALVQDAAQGDGEGPQQQSEKRPSLGTVGHPGNCRPCAWMFRRDTPAGCEKGATCAFCHLCGVGELKRRKRNKLAKTKMGKWLLQGKKQKQDEEEVDAVKGESWHKRHRSSRKAIA